MGINGAYCNIIEAGYSSPTAITILSGEKLKAFPVRSGKRQRCSLLTFLFCIVLEVLARTVEKKEYVKGIEIGDKIKLS